MSYPVVVITATPGEITGAFPHAPSSSLVSLVSVAREGGRPDALVGQENGYRF